MASEATRTIITVGFCVNETAAQLGISDDDLGWLGKLHPGTVRAILDGSSKMISLDVLGRLLTALDTDDLSKVFRIQREDRIVRRGYSDPDSPEVEVTP